MKDFINRIIFRIGLSLLALFSLILLTISIEYMVILAQISIATIILYSLVCDLKTRKIRNQRFKDLYLFSLLLISIDILFSSNILLFFPIFNCRCDDSRNNQW